VTAIRSGAAFFARGFRPNSRRLSSCAMVRAQAMASERTVLDCRPEWLAVVVPPTPEESTCVVLTGKPIRAADRGNMGPLLEVH